MKFRTPLAFGCVVVPLFLLTTGACANGGEIAGGAGGSGGSGGPVTTGVGSTNAQSSVASTTTSKSSTAAGMANSSSADASSSNASSAASTGAGLPTCTDPGPGEPNDTKATAFNMGTIDDDDSDGKSVMGMLGEGGSDVDWYRYGVADTSPGVVDPTRQLFGPGLRVCKYIACTNGNDPEVSCPAGTTADSQGGVDGCCWTGGQSVTIDFGCSFLGIGSDDIDVWLRIDHQGGPGCESYKVDFHG